MFAIHSRIQELHSQSYAGDYLAKTPVLNGTGVPYIKILHTGAQKNILQNLSGALFFHHRRCTATAHSVRLWASYCQLL